MAKRRRKSSGTKTRTVTKVIRASGASPIVRVQVPRTQQFIAGARRVGGRARSAGRRVGGAAWNERGMILPIAASWAMGHFEKTGDLARIPRFFGLGPNASAGLIAYAVSKWLIPSPTMKSVALGALCVAANTHGRTGVIGEELAGDYPGGGVVFG